MKRVSTQECESMLSATIRSISFRLMINTGSTYENEIEEKNKDKTKNNGKHMIQKARNLTGSGCFWIS